MITFKPFKIGHLSLIKPLQEQRVYHAQLLNSHYTQHMEEGVCMSAWLGLRCIAAAGCVPIFPHRAVAWAVMSEEAVRNKLSVIKKMREVLTAAPYRRIEMSVRHDFENGHRLAKAVGMKLETPEPLMYYGFNGEHEMIYSMVKTWQH